MIKNFLFITFLLFYSSLFSQKYRLVSGSVPNENALEFKWFTKDVNLDASFDLYRTEAGQNNWVKINEKPIRRSVPLTSSQIESLTSIDEKDALLIYSSAMNDKTIDKKTSFGFMMINAIMNNKLAEVCGIYFKDNTINVSSSYDYKLTLAENENALFTLKNIQYNANYSPESVSNFTGKSGNKIATFNWNYNQEIPIYKIYRGVQSGVYDSSFTVFPSDESMKKSRENIQTYVDNLSNTNVGSTYYYKVSSIDFF